MDRRLKLTLLVVGAAAVQGCKTSSPAAPTAGMPGSSPGLTASGSPRLFDPAKPPFGVPASVSMASPARKPAGPLKPDTEAQLAIVDLESALLQPSGSSRDPLIDSARQKFARALAADPANRLAAEGLARLYAAVGDKDAAIATLQTACHQHPTEHRLYHRLAAVNIQFGEYAAAQQACQAALQIDPKNRVYLKTLALSQAHQNDWDGAFGSLVTTNVMTQPEARYFLGRTLLDVGRIEDGKAQIAEALRLEPNYQLAAQTLADMNAGPGVPATVPGQGVVNVGYETGAGQ